VHTVSADHDSRPLVDGAAAPAVARDSGDSIVVPQQRLYSEPLSQFYASLDGCIHEQLVQHRASRAESPASAVGVGHRAFQRERAHIENQVEGDRRAAGPSQAIEQPPAVHDLGAMRPDDVCGDGVARKSGPIDQQNPIAFAG
jgi:hypothetical protein